MSLAHIYHPIKQIVIYAGHQLHPDFGPYKHNVLKRIEMFQYLNCHFRKPGLEKPWRIISVYGEQLTDHLKQFNPHDLLLVVPAGQSTHLDNVFADKEISFLKNWFELGGRGYFNCGSAYWVSRLRRYDDVCLQTPTMRKTIEKEARLKLFEGVAQGPLCPYPGHHYRVGFFSDAVQLQSSKQKCTVLLSGGGSFIPDSGHSVKTLWCYCRHELKRLGKKEEQYAQWEKAAILIKRGRGGALLSMAHPYYNAHDLDIAAYESAFPESGTDWRQIHARLTPTHRRMQFVYTSLIRPLECLNACTPSH